MATRPDASALKRLADHVKARRAELRMHKIDVVREAGLTPITYYKIENGDPVRETTYAKIEPVLRWAVGSCLAVLGGGEPTLAEPMGASGAYYSPVTPGDLEHRVGQAVTNAAIAVTDLPAPQIRALKQAVVDELLGRGAGKENRERQA